jgi:uncharacterized membrane protein YdbT with pleckstrin-like domain
MPDERAQLMRRSLVAGAYERVIDRESAFEILQARIEKKQQEEAAEQAREDQEKADELARKEAARQQKEEDRLARERAKDKGILGDLTKTIGQSVTRQIGSTIGRQIVRGLLGGLLGGKKKLF